MSTLGKHWKNKRKWRNPTQVEGEGKRPTLRIYNIWKGIRGRCYFAKPHDYPHYQGRGIEMCLEWKDDYDAFYDWAMTNGYDDSLQIDREDTDGNYCPENCRFVEDSANRLNKRASGKIPYRGVYVHKNSARRAKQYSAVIWMGKSIHLGTHDTAEQAAEAFDEYAKANGYMGILNFNNTPQSE